MITKLLKAGDSWAIPIDKDVMDSAKINPETLVDVSAKGDCIILAPIRDTEEQKKFEEALEKVNKNYGAMLQRLAD
jgi:antitoxin MazE